jgi:hypothetical protein
MDLAVYMISAVFIVFFVGAVFALVASIAAGQWNNLDSAAMLVLDIDDPYPDRPASDEGA